jgi:hypothetical protein
VVRPPSWPCQGVVRPPWWPSVPPLRLFKASRSPNPKSIGVFREEVLQLRHCHRRIWGDRSLCSGTLPGRESAPGAISIDVVTSSAVSIDFTAISTNVVVSLGPRDLPVAMWFTSLSHDVIFMWSWALYLV